MGAIKQALLDVVGRNQYETKIRLRELDQQLGDLYGEMIRHSASVRSARKDIEYKLDRCDQDFEMGWRVFYSESLVGDVAKYERELAKYTMLEQRFCDLWHDASLPSEIVLELIVQSRVDPR
jgi:hypothetical protein